jgi:hypothetical protein
LSWARHGAGVRSVPAAHTVAGGGATMKGLAMIANDLVSVIWEALSAMAAWLARHVTLAVGAAALIAVACLVQQDLALMQAADEQLARLGRDLNNIETIGEDLAALDAAHLEYARSRTPQHRDERDGAVMHTYLALRSVRRGMEQGEVQDREWNELAQLVSAKIDDDVIEAADPAGDQARARYSAEVRLFVVVQQIQREQLKRVRDAQAMRVDMERENEADLLRALAIGFGVLLVSGVADTLWQSRFSRWHAS